jgi:hypothetical protein
VCLKGTLFTPLSKKNTSTDCSLPPLLLLSLLLHQVCLKGTLFTPLSKKNTSTQSLNVQMRKDLGLGVNLVHGFSLPNVPTRHQDLDIVVIRWVYWGRQGVGRRALLVVAGFWPRVGGFEELGSAHSAHHDKALWWSSWVRAAGSCSGALSRLPR